ncbi:UNVERIFIED_CONTAM: hypothetical protein Slati_2819300 [Sesamum latifolium]|uniref:Reverse transcriptase Ty1/copia-type domain-containing protein n=1 Tax=Sesamum latifolium TaxID=2727402 RepID=A0AAW2V9P9_9LAMI
MVSNKVLEHGLINSVILLVSLDFAVPSRSLVFVQTKGSGAVVLAIYVDDILISGSDVGIEEAKTYLRKHFATKIWGDQGISWGLKSLVASMGSTKYGCDLFQETGLLGTKPVDTPTDSNPDFWNDDGNYLEAKTKYRTLVGKIIYLTETT